MNTTKRLTEPQKEVMAIVDRLGYSHSYAFTRLQMRSVRSLIRRGELHFRLGLINKGPRP